MFSIAESPRPWEKPFQVGDNLAISPVFEAAIHADNRLSPDARGALLAFLSFPAWSVVGYTTLTQAQPEAAKALVRELYEAGYLQLHSYEPTLIGSLCNATLFGATPLAAAVSYAQSFRFVTEQEAYDFVSSNAHLLDAEHPECLTEALVDSFPVPPGLGGKSMAIEVPDEEPVEA